MSCPKCGRKTFVLMVRERNGERVRKRECPRCGYVFWTKEIPDARAETKLKIADADRHRKEEPDERG